MAAVPDDGMGYPESCTQTESIGFVSKDIWPRYVESIQAEVPWQLDFGATVHGYADVWFKSPS